MTQNSPFPNPSPFPRPLTTEFYPLSQIGSKVHPLPSVDAVSSLARDHVVGMAQVLVTLKRILLCSSVMFIIYLL